MGKIEIVRSHKLGVADARKAVHQLAEDISTKLDAKTNWKGDTLVFKRSGANGTIEVEDTTVKVKVDLGLMLTPMKGMIEQQINSYLDEHL